MLDKSKKDVNKIITRNRRHINGSYGNVFMTEKSIREAFLTLRERRSLYMDDISTQFLQKLALALLGALQVKNSMIDITTRKNKTMAVRLHGLMKKSHVDFAKVLDDEKDENVTDISPGNPVSLGAVDVTFEMTKVDETHFTYKQRSNNQC